jgi:hypothetical protein
VSVTERFVKMFTDVPSDHMFVLVCVAGIVAIFLIQPGTDEDDSSQH